MRLYAVQYYYLAQGMDKADDYLYTTISIPSDETLTIDQIKDRAMDQVYEAKHLRQWTQSCLRVTEVT